MFSKPQPPSPNFDRNHLHKIRANFLSVNQFRLERAKESLTDSQRLFLDVLPALFHYNHPMLPGYCLRSTPAGLSDFQLSAQTHQQLRRLAKSFHPNRNDAQRADILSIFAMGSLGTIAQNEKSDIDLWLCYQPELSEKAIAMLQQKATKLTEWAAKWHLDTTIFLMNDRLFREGNKQAFNKEASGTTQHLLLLDEFYRTGLHLGGQLPIWFFLNEDMEKNYSKNKEELIEKRLLPDKSFIDFGPIPHIPSSEFLSAAIWQLYKAIESPHKSIIKLLIIEAYTKNPQGENLLSYQAKRFLHHHNQEDELVLQDIDPYLQSYYFIEKYLIDTQQVFRLNLLRKCFYIKIFRPAISLHAYQHPSKKQTIEALIKDWKWSQKDVNHLQNRHHWKLSDIIEERRLIIEELNHSYHFIMDFFREKNSNLDASNRELNILGRKIQAAFSRKPGKIDWINPYLTNSLAEKQIYITEDEKWSAITSKWVAYSEQNELITSKDSLTEALVWLHCNQILAEHSKISFKNPDEHSNWPKVIHQAIAQSLPSPLRLANHQAFLNKSINVKIICFIEAEKTKLSKTKDDAETQAFNAQCMINIVKINSWNEIICQQKKGTIIECLLEIFLESLNKKTSTSPQLDTHFSKLDFKNLLDKKIIEIYESIANFFTKNIHGRFLVKTQNHYLMAESGPLKNKITRLKSESALTKALRKPTFSFSPVTVYETRTSGDLLNLYNQYNRPNSLQVFFRPRGIEADVTVIDEASTFFFTTLENYQNSKSLIPIHHFLRAVHGGQGGDISPLNILPIHFYEVIKSEREWGVKSCIISSQLNRTGHANIEARAIMHKKKMLFELSLNGKHYSELDLGDQAYHDIGGQMNKMRDSNTHYQVVNVDLSQYQRKAPIKGQLNSCQYLEAKTLLETKINKALAKL